MSDKSTRPTTEEPPRRGKTVKICLLLSPPLAEALETASANEHRLRPDLMREMLTQGLRERELWPPRMRGPAA